MLGVLGRKQYGVGLIEVVVALFILAVGLLGVLAMQANGIKGNQKAAFSTEAHFLAQDMVDRIRAYNDIDIATDDDDYHGIDVGSNSIPADPGCSVTGCSSANQITYDQFDWGTKLASRLPSGRGQVSYDDASSVYTLTVMWDGSQDGSTGTTCTGASGQLHCYKLEFKL